MHPAIRADLLPLPRDVSTLRKPAAEQVLRGGGIEAAGDGVFLQLAIGVGEERAHFPRRVAAVMRPDQPHIGAHRRASYRLRCQHVDSRAQPQQFPPRSIVGVHRIDNRRFINTGQSHNFGPFLWR